MSVFLSGHTTFATSPQRSQVRRRNPPERGCTDRAGGGRAQRTAASRSQNIVAGRFACIG